MSAKHPTTLFPMPRNRKAKPTDENVLLHAIAIAIRDHSSHAKLRRLIAHLPKIMNRVTPYTAEQANFVRLEAENAEIKEALKVAARKFKALEKLHPHPGAKFGKKVGGDILRTDQSAPPGANRPTEA